MKEYTTSYLEKGDDIIIGVAEGTCVRVFWGSKNCPLNFRSMPFEEFHKTCIKNLNKGYKHRNLDTAEVEFFSNRIASMGLPVLAKRMAEELGVIMVKMELPPKEFKPAKKKSEVVNFPVVCRNNVNFESEFELGVEYLCLKKIRKNYLVINMLGEERLMNESRFETRYLNLGEDDE